MKSRSYRGDGEPIVDNLSGDNSDEGERNAAALALLSKAIGLGYTIECQRLMISVNEPHKLVTLEPNVEFIDQLVREARMDLCKCAILAGSPHLDPIQTAAATAGYIVNELKSLELQPPTETPNDENAPPSFTEADIHGHGSDLWPEKTID
ncbi:hypothetical protein [Arthrobacter sp. KNU40]|uniref:hypothetical protein n=1 Tax=Arthrobacter sp. KNU40 TaxID=3447965 RepID=UPI003F5DC3B9